jgi:hypothetical protein
MLRGTADGDTPRKKNSAEEKIYRDHWNGKKKVIRRRVHQSYLFVTHYACWIRMAMIVCTPREG